MTLNKAADCNHQSYIDAARQRIKQYQVNLRVEVDKHSDYARYQRECLREDKWWLDGAKVLEGIV